MKRTLLASTMSFRQPDSEASGPVVIGGVGGSGTRLAAFLLRELGFYIGDELNKSLDNLWFVLLFRRPAWHEARPAQIPMALRLFEKAMQGEPRLNPAEQSILRVALAEWSKTRQAAFKCARSLRVSKGPLASAAGWGWKNPTTHVYLEELSKAFPKMKYVHVIRNGLELVESGKLPSQLRSWGSVLGIDPPVGEAASTPRVELQYWIRANHRALSLGANLLGDRFLLVRYESLCADPDGAVDAVSDFLGVRASPALRERFASLVQPRAKRPNAEGDKLGNAELADVEALGYPCR